MNRKQGSCEYQAADVPPLISTCLKTGTAYTRRADVEAEIRAALQLPVEQWLDHAPLRGGWKNETRVHLLRRLRGGRQDALFGEMLHRLMRRIAPMVEKWSRGFLQVDLESIQTTVGERIVERILDAKVTRTSEFVEVSLSTVVKRETLKEVDRRRVRSNINGTAPDVRNPEGELLDPVANVREDRPDPLQALIIKNRPRLREILKAVKDPRHRLAFILFEVRDWPYHARNPGEPCLCSKFNLSERQIRTWIGKARADMLKFLGDQS